MAKVIAEGNLAEAGQAIAAMQPAMRGKTKDEPSQLFAAVCLIKGEKPRWRWGKD